MQRFQLLFKRNKVWRLNRIKVNSSQNKNQQSLQGNNRSRVYMMYHHNELYTAEITRHIKKQGNIIMQRKKAVNRNHHQENPNLGISRQVLYCSYYKNIQGLSYYHNKRRAEESQWRNRTFQRIKWKNAFYRLTVYGWLKSK